MTFDGRNVVVTGGTGALGGAVVAVLLEQGAVCHVPVRGAAARGVAWAGHDRVHVAPDVDLTDAASVDAFYDGLPLLWASIHCAGGFAMGHIEQSEPKDFAAMMQGNVATAWWCCRAAARVMLAGKAGGRIVNVSARPALDPRKGAGMAAYTASKAAVAALTAALAEELKGADILVNAVAPSTLDTPDNRAGMPKADFSKWVSLEAAAGAMLQLASPRNLAISGTIAAIYGKA